MKLPVPESIIHSCPQPYGFRALLAGVDVRWVDSGQELADGLTKCWKHDQLLKVLGIGIWKIVYDPLFDSYKSKKEMAQWPDV